MRLPQRFRWIERDGETHYGACLPKPEGWWAVTEFYSVRFYEDPWENLGQVIGDAERFEWIDNDFNWHGDVMKKEPKQ